ncbi:UNVERIFIED_CONTAM: hypothetical protein K2H54_047129 [Gekko kuhli]
MRPISVWCLTLKDFRVQELPLARIKKIMKLDEDVKMISAEAPVLFAKAAQIFITELTLRAWIHTEDNKRRTLQRNDIAMAITKFDQFDFLIDIVPRDELKPPKRQNCHLLCLFWAVIAPVNILDWKLYSAQEGFQSDVYSGRLPQSS